MARTLQAWLKSVPLGKLPPPILFDVCTWMVNLDLLVLKAGIPALHPSHGEAVCAHTVLLYMLK